MSEPCVLDASAVLALLHREPGEQAVRAVLRGALLSTVNLAEIVSKLVEQGLPAAEARADVVAFPLRLVQLDAETAEVAGSFRLLTRAARLSLGDRCCLALARRSGAVALTTDRSWSSIAAAVGVTVRDIRPAS